MGAKSTFNKMKIFTALIVFMFLLFGCGKSEEEKKTEAWEKFRATEAAILLGMKTKKDFITYREIFEGTAKEGEKAKNTIYLEWWDDN